MAIDERSMNRLGIVAGIAPWDNEVCYRIVPCGERLLFARHDDRLLVREDPETQRTEWALLGWIAGSVSGPGAKPEEKFDSYEMVAHGDGPAGILREARHTYFGDDGYVFYVNPNLLTWAFKELRRWFDFDGDRTGKEE